MKPPAASCWLPVAGVILGTTSWLAAKPLELAPPFPTASADKWIGAPATWESLRGRVVLLDVWTFG